MKEKGMVLWFTGRPSSGKSTIVDSIYPILKQKYTVVEILYGGEHNKC